MLAQSCRSLKERNLFIVALVVSAFVWLGIVVSLVGLLYAPFVALGVVIGHAFFLARVTGHSIRVGSRQLPELYKRVENAASKLGLERMPEVYVTTGGGILNAFATRLFSRNFVILNAEILDACESVDAERGPGEPSAVDFIIGHEIGHLALGHLSWNWLLWPAKLFPLLGPAYSRACEYSCDACGLAVVEDVETSSRALAVLAAGGRQARKVSIDALMEQRHDTGSLVMALVELNSTHPFLSKRVAALHRLKDQGMAPEIGRNPLSYVMAPFFGFAAGGGAALFTVYMYVAVIGVLAAIAIPNFEKFQERAALAEAGGPVAVLDEGDEGDARHPGDAQALGDADVATPPTSLEQLLKDLEQKQAAAPDAAPSGVVGGGGENGDEMPTPRFEAKPWLKGQLVAHNQAAVAGLPTAKAIALVDKLTKNGAPKVWVAGVGVDDEGAFANFIVAEMPAKPALRKKLTDLCTAEHKKLGAEDGCVDDGGPYLFFQWQ